MKKNITTLEKATVSLQKLIQEHIETARDTKQLQVLRRGSAQQLIIGLENKPGGTYTSKEAVKTGFGSFGDVIGRTLGAERCQEIGNECCSKLGFTIEEAQGILAQTTRS